MIDSIQPAIQPVFQNSNIWVFFGIDVVGALKLCVVISFESSLLETTKF